MNARAKLSEHQTDPYGYYTTVRNKAQFERIVGDMPLIKWSHLVTRYDDVAALARDPRLGSDPNLGGGFISLKDSPLVPKGYRAWLNSMVFKDGKDHSRLRKLVSQAFKPSMVKEWEGVIVDITNELMDNMEKKSSIDFVRDFAAPLPITVISKIMGVSDDQAELFAKYSLAFVDKMPSTYWDLITQIKHISNLQKFLDRLIESKRKTPGDDLTTALLDAEEGEDKLDSLELTGMLLLLLIAGHETTVNLVSSGLLGLLEHPEQISAFQEDPTLVSPMIEELLRYSSPVQISSRYAKETFEFNGNIINKGEHVTLCVGSANHDESQFENPNKLDITRSPNNHLAFGFGQHFCLGAQLARLEGKIAITTLFERYPNVQLAVPSSNLEWRKSNIVRGLMALPITLQ